MKSTLAIAAVLSLLLVSVGCTEITDTPASVSSTPSSSSAASEAVAPPAATEKVTMGQKNALAKAKEYLSVAAFSHEGLVKQLEFEKFSNEDAVYGADNCGADWNEQAAEKAKSYMDISSFSKDGLIEQLKFEGFTEEQAVHGVTANGY